MNALKADPRSVDLRSQASHFYRLGVKILQLFEEEEMVDVLSDVSNFLVFYIFLFLLHLLSSLNRHSKSAQCKLRTTPTIQRAHWAVASSSFVVWMKQKDNVSVIRFLRFSQSN